MSRNKFDDNCRGCRPAIMNADTGEVYADGSPEMKMAMAAWELSTLREREAFHRFTCLNSRKALDVRLAMRITDRIAKGLEALDHVH